MSFTGITGWLLVVAVALFVANEIRRGRQVRKIRRELDELTAVRAAVNANILDWLDLHLVAFRRASAEDGSRLCELEYLDENKRRATQRGRHLRECAMAAMVVEATRGMGGAQASSSGSAAANAHASPGWP